MNRSAVFHQVTSPWCFQISTTQVSLLLRTGHDVTQVTLVYGDPHEGHQVNGVWGWRKHEEAMVCNGKGVDHTYWSLTIQPPQKRLKYQFILHEDKARSVYGERGFEPIEGPHDHFNFFFVPYVHPESVYHAPAWVKETVWYQIFPDRFHREPAATEWPTGPVTNATHYGGNLNGIRAKLPYLAKLGITGLYLTPIFISPSSHKYDTTDYFTIDPAFGTENDLRRLVKEAHQLGIRVMLDAVFNHAGLNFKPWVSAQSDPNSPYRSWFKYHEDGAYETFAYAKNMPKLNTSNPEVIQYFCRVGQYWIKTCDIDGWRLDVANEVAPEFWRAFRQSVRSLKDVYILGEVWHDANPWLNGDMFDGVMNYFYTRVLMDYLLLDAMDLPTFKAKIIDFRNRYPHPVLPNQFNLLDSHDTARLMTQANGNLSRVKQVLAMMLLSEGSPCIYYGTEIGMEGGQDPDCRRLMQFDPDPTQHELYQFISALIELRKRFPQLSVENTWEWVDVPNLIAIQRGEILIVMNPSDRVVKNPFKGQEVYALNPTHDLQPRDVRVLKHKTKRAFLIKNNVLRRVLTTVSIVMLMISFGLFIEDAISSFNYRQTESDLDGLIEEVTEDVIDTTTENPDDFPVETIVKGSDAFHTKLAATNADYVGWITLEGLDLDYPMVLGEDNAYYLTHSFYKKYSKYGTIFMDYRNKPDFSQAHTVLYGHHMRDNTMFARLDDLRKKANYAANSTFTVYTPNGIKTYRIFSVYPVDASTTTIALPATDSDVQTRIADYKKKSLYATGVDTSKATHLVTLVTCTWVVDNGRLLVHAIEVNEP